MNSSPTDRFSWQLSDWAYALGRPTVQAEIRSQPEDFQVDEDLGFTADGEGEHVLLRIRKCNANTDWVARELAHFSGVKPMNVSYAGLKDRNAITTQWFSVQVPVRTEVDWAGFNPEGVSLLETVRHGRKLRRGALAGNRFTILLRDPQGDRDDLEQRLQAVKAAGVPNYFGEQRFGHDRGNLDKAVALFEGRLKERNRTKRGLYLSSARSFIFNEVLGRRVTDGTWNRILPGDCLILNGTRSFFVADEPDETLQARLTEGDVHSSGPLWGRGPLATRGEAAALETEVSAPFEALRAGLEAEGMVQERRALRLPVREMNWQEGDDGVLLRFWLPAGTFATAVLRELVVPTNA